LSTPRRRKSRPAPLAPPHAPAEAREPSRSELRDAAARAALEPLAAGERPAALLSAIVVAALLALGNVIAYAAGAKIAGRHPGPGVLAFTAFTGMLAVGMWLARYWAVLTFQALLTLIILAFTLFLIEASNVEALVLCVGVICAAGWLFYKLVRVMGRLAAVRAP
jgi:hypothetical protein